MGKKYIMIISTIIIILGGIYYLGFNLIYNSFCNELSDQQLKTVQYQSKFLSNMISEKLEYGIPMDEIVNSLKTTLENFSTESVLFCLFDRSGKEICHPDRIRTGTVIKSDDSLVRSISNENIGKDNRTILSQYNVYTGPRSIIDGNEVVYLRSIKNTDWIIASHADLLSLKNTLSNVKIKLQLFFIFIWSISVVLILFLINILYQKYFSKISYNSVHKTPIVEKKEAEPQKGETSQTTKRFLAEKGLKLVPVEAANIAFVYLENKITYIVDLHGNKSTLNLSLEEVYQMLPKEQFFRVSRQMILSLKSIRNIEKYGLTQLRAITYPVSEIPVVISKSKVSQFKLWMGK